MFIGIVETTAEVLRNENGRLRIMRPATFDDLKIGASIAVSGVCLTLVGMTKNSMDFDVIEETLARSNLGSKKPGDRVNLERAMKAGGRLDGHIVQGHVEGAGTVISHESSVMRKSNAQDSRLKTQDSKTLVIQLPGQLSKNIIPKGSIAIDGVSLTVKNIEQNLCSLSLIPHTAKVTTLGSLRVGDRVNVETDVMTRTQRVS